MILEETLSEIEEDFPVLQPPVVEYEEEPDFPIYWHSNAPWYGTGYGSQTALFGPALQQLGYRVAFGAFAGLHGARVPWYDRRTNREFTVYPGGRHAYGNDVIGAHAKHWFNGRDGLVITLTDPWVLSPEIVSRLDTLAWTPVDHEPLMPRTHVWLAKAGAIPLAMSRFGEGMIKRNGFSPLYVPHGFDPDIFQPLDRKHARKVLGISEDAFVVGMVSANRGVPSRKCFSEAFQAFQAFRNQVGRQAILYVHTNMEDPEGENLVAMCESLGITPMVTDPYQNALGQPAQAVAALMSAFDVLLCPSQGEGFGVPLVESQAVGTPCITTDFSASPEVAPEAVGNWNVSGSPVWTGFEAWQLRPDVELLTACLVEAFEEPEQFRLERRESVRKWAHSEYTVEHVTETYWKPVIEDALATIRWKGQRMVKA